MRVQSKEWLELKKEFIKFVKLFEEDSERFNFPVDDEQDFIIEYDDKKILPIFTKKDNYLRVEYDLFSCDTNIRKIAFCKYYETLRIEITLK